MCLAHAKPALLYLSCALQQARGEYGDEEFDPKSMQRSGSMRPGGMGGMRTDSRSDLMMGGGMDKKGVGAQKGAAVKTPPGKGSLQRIDPMGKGSQGMARGGPWGRSQGLGQGPWSQQDDQLLIAIVAEFNQNWHLVADVLRSASSMSGVTRKFDMCKHRYMQLAKEHFMQQVRLHVAVAAAVGYVYSAPCVRYGGRRHQSILLLHHLEADESDAHIQFCLQHFNVTWNCNGAFMLVCTSHRPTPVLCCLRRLCWFRIPTRTSMSNAQKLCWLRP